MKIYIGFSKPKSKFVPFAWLIQWVESRPYDHCYIRFQEPSGDWMIYQASKEMVNLYNTTIWNQTNQPVKEYELEITSEQAANLWKFIKQNLGLPYSLLEDFGILVMKILHLKKNPFNQDGAAAFCSQEAAQVCELLNIPLPEDSSAIDPTAMDSILSQQGFKETNDPIF